MNSGLQKLFGTDGIRGRVGLEPITESFAERLGYVFGSTLGAFLAVTNKIGPLDFFRPLNKKAENKHDNKRLYNI